VTTPNNSCDYELVVLSLEAVVVVVVVVVVE
jgi:hypothetical protein